jgi:anti-sigma B factor antagonist
VSSFCISDYLVEDGVCVVCVGGYLDFDVAPRLKRCLVQRTQEGARVILVDLSEAGFIDSTGIGVLVGALKRLREADGALAVISANENVSSIFEIVGLENVIPMYANRDDALAALAQPA